MKKLNEVLGLKLIDADVGIEIECEGRNISAVNSGFWKTEDDGSLRGEFPHEKAEFVLKKPIKAQHIEKALDSLINAQAEAQFNFSYRTSVHVHVNCLHMDADQLTTFAYSYLIFETVLLDYCGEGRKGNRFCLRLRDAEQQLNPLIWIIKDGIDQVGNIGGDAYRYAAMNMASLPKYGSLEFRAMRGNMDKDVLMTWTTALLELREFASKYANPKKLYEAVGNDGVEALFVKAFPTTHNALRVQGMNQDILESVSLAIEIPFEWEKRRTAPKKEVVYQTFVMDDAMARGDIEEARAVQELRRRAAAGMGQQAVPADWRDFGQLPRGFAPNPVPRGARPVPRGVFIDDLAPPEPERHPDDQDF